MLTKNIDIISPSWFANPNSIDIRLDDLVKGLLIAAEESFPQSNSEWFLRYRQCSQFVVPYLMSLNLPLQRKVALEVGCGTGAKTMCLSKLFDRFLGIDLNKEYLQEAKRKKLKMSCDNVELIHAEAEDISQFLNSLDCQVDVIFLYAVIEHLTIEERIRTIQTCWDYLREGGILYIGELPNRLCPVDHHSSFLPYFDSLPDQLALKYAKFSQRERFVKNISESLDPIQTLYRNGRGGSFHEFELSISPVEDLINYIRLDNYHNYMVNMNPVRGYEVNLLKEFKTLPTTNTSTPKEFIPPMFSRYWIDGVLVKGKEISQTIPNQKIKDTFFVEPEIESFYKRYVDLQFDNIIYALIKNKGRLIFKVPENVNEFTFGFLKHKTKGELSILDSNKNIVFSETIDKIISRSISYWNPYIYITIKLKDIGEVIEIRSVGEHSYISIVTPYFH